MKKIVAIFLLISLLAQVSSKLIVLTGYEINKEYIAKNLCENRNKPAMHCNGKCHLAKELKKEEKRDQSPFNNQKEEITILYFSELPALIIHPASTDIANSNYSSYIEKPYSTILYSVFHPPQA